MWLTCLAVFETELVSIQGVKPEPVPSVAKPNETPQASPSLAEKPAPTHSVAEVATTAAPVAAPTTSAIAQGSPLDDEQGDGECNLLGDFALLVQGALGLLAVSSLAVKRWREHPRRPVKIWFFDASKQVFGSVLLHLANILMSMLSSGKFDVASSTNATPQLAATAKGDQPNPCSFYLLNLAIDVSHNLESPRISILIPTDNHWYPYPCPPPQSSLRRRPTHAPCQPARVYPLRKLWPSPARNLVAQTVRHLLPRLAPHEALRPRHFRLPSLDRMGR
jgi:hypothetical protein